MEYLCPPVWDRGYEIRHIVDSRRDNDTAQRVETARRGLSDALQQQQGRLNAFRERLESFGDRLAASLRRREPAPVEPLETALGNEVSGRIRELSDLEEDYADPLEVVVSGSGPSRGILVKREEVEAGPSMPPPTGASVYPSLPDQLAYATLPTTEGGESKRVRFSLE